MHDDDEIHDGARKHKRRHRRKPKCPRTGKAMLDSEDEAWRCAMWSTRSNIVARADREHLVCSPYQCPHCGAWHITSHPLTTAKRPR